MQEPQQTQRDDHVVHEFFLASVIIKGLISLAEVVTGIAVLFIPTNWIVAATLFVLNYIPNAKLQIALMGEVASFTGSTALFISLYLLSRGIIKVLLVWGLLKGKLQAYPLSLIVLAVLVFYQLYEIFTSTFSIIITGITLFDLVVMYFVWREWKIVLRHQRSVS